MIIDFHPAADAESWAAADWYEQQESELGTRFEAAVYEALAQIGASLRAWKSWPENPAVLREVDEQLAELHEMPKGAAPLGRLDGERLRAADVVRRPAHSWGNDAGRRGGSDRFRHPKKSAPPAGHRSQIACRPIDGGASGRTKPRKYVPLASTRP